MSIEKVILGYLEKNPGASAKKILIFFESFPNASLDAERKTMQAAICKKLRTLKRERKVHNNRNSWYLMTPK